MTKTELKNALNAKATRTKIKIDVLDWNTENKIKSLEGYTTAGSLNIDGSSSVRRTASLTVALTGDNYKLTDPANILSVNKKIRISFMTQDLSHPDLAQEWTNMGIFVITKPSISINTGGYSVTLTLQDKMCLHNGTISGKIDAPTRFDIENTNIYDDYISDFIDKISLVKANPSETACNNAITSLRTIYNSVVAAQDNSYYYELKEDLSSVYSMDNGTPKTQKVENIVSNGYKFTIEISQPKLTIRNIIFYVASELAGENPGKILISVPEKVRTPVTMVRTDIEAADAEKPIPTGAGSVSAADSTTIIGYKMIDYIYPKELNFNSGSNLTQVYDACKEILGGNYEYYYDREGNFHFEEIKNYKYNRSADYSALTNMMYHPNFNQNAIIFDFSDSRIATSYANSLSWDNIKNDITIFSHNDNTDYKYRIIIGEKPEVPDPVIHPACAGMDWKEYITHQYNCGGNGDFIGKGTDAPSELTTGQVYYKTITTEEGTTDAAICGYYNSDGKIQTSDLKRGAIKPQYYEDAYLWCCDLYGTDIDNICYYGGNKKNVITPKIRHIEFTILDNDSYFNKYNTQVIGTRNWSVANNDIKSLYPTTVDYFAGDNVIFLSENEITQKMHDNPTKTRAEVIQMICGDLCTSDIPAVLKNTATEDNSILPYGSIYSDAFTQIKQLLFEKTNANDQITISSTPFYGLEPNNRVKAYFPKASINGYYMLSKMSFNFDENGLMNSTLVQANVIEQ